MKTDKTFLIVEDEESHVQLIDAMLNAINYRDKRVISFSVNDAKRAEQVYIDIIGLHEEIDFLIVDQKLSNRTVGTGLIQFARNYPFYDLSNTVIILMTALDPDSEEGIFTRKRAEELDCLFLQKPFDIIEFQKLIVKKSGFPVISANNRDGNHRAFTKEDFPEDQ